MKLLLDTHVLIWWCLDERLSADARDAIASPDTEVAFSVASVWETEIKRQAGKLTFTKDLLTEVRAHGFRDLPITSAHAIAAAQLPPHHGDPFDRVMLGQALVEGMTVVTRDAMFRRYDVPLIEA